MSGRLHRGTMALLAGTALACAAGLATADPIKPGQEQGLGLTGADVPDELKKIAADPYAAPGDCEQINNEIVELDRILGPDKDSGVQPASSGVGTTVAPLVRSFIPYRNVVRFVTGANRKDNELTQAAMAGWERRGFLKGLQKHCNAPDPAEIAAAAAPPAARTAPLAAPGLNAAAPITTAVDANAAARPAAQYAQSDTPAAAAPSTVSGAPLPDEAPPPPPQDDAAPPPSWSAPPAEPAAVDSQPAAYVAPPETPYAPPPGR